MKGIIFYFLMMKWMDMRLRSTHCLLGWPTPPDHIKSSLNSEFDSCNWQLATPLALANWCVG